MTTLTVAELIAQIKQDRINGTSTTLTTKTNDGLWWEHQRDSMLRKASAKADEVQARRIVAAEVREELAAKRKAEGYRW